MTDGNESPTPRGLVFVHGVSLQGLTKDENPTKSAPLLTRTTNLGVGGAGSGWGGRELGLRSTRRFDPQPGARVAKNQSLAPMSLSCVRRTLSFGLGSSGHRSRGETIIIQ